LKQGSRRSASGLGEELLSLKKNNQKSRQMFAFIEKSPYHFPIVRATRMFTHSTTLSDSPPSCHADGGGRPAWGRGFLEARYCGEKREVENGETKSTLAD
jgi:hypothetical protein